MQSKQWDLLVQTGQQTTIQWPTLQENLSKSAAKPTFSALSPGIHVLVNIQAAVLKGDELHKGDTSICDTVSVAMVCDHDSC